VILQLLTFVLYFPAKYLNSTKVSNLTESKVGLLNY